MNNLSLKQKDVLIRWELFCLWVAKGEVAGKVYDNIYDSKNIDIAYANASRLLRNDKVQARIKELREEIKTEGIADTREVQKRVTVILREDTFNLRGNPIRGSNLQAADILCKINKLYSDNPSNTNTIVNIISNIPRPAKKEIIDVKGGTEVVHSLQEGKDLPADWWSPGLWCLFTKGCQERQG